MKLFKDKNEPKYDIIYHPSGEYYDRYIVWSDGERVKEFIINTYNDDPIKAKEEALKYVEKLEQADRMSKGEATK